MICANHIDNTNGLFGIKARLAIVSALDNVLANSQQIETRLAGQLSLSL